MPDELELIAYHLDERPAMPLVPAARWRDWMEETYRRNANRCLPLLVANEAGWVLLNERRFTAEWSGGLRPDAVTIHYEGRRPSGPAVSNFGYGILTFAIPYVFRTPPGFDLLARGPANMPRDGIDALEGLVETDWASSPFTMNWKFTRPGEVTFEEGEPVCLIVPQRRHDLQSFSPAIREADPTTAERWRAAMRSRHELAVKKFLAEYSAEHAAARDAWESDYFRGRAPDGAEAQDHVTKRRLQPFD
jgi:hypothetical protein